MIKISRISIIKRKNNDLQGTTATGPLAMETISSLAHTMII